VRLFTSFRPAIVDAYVLRTAIFRKAAVIDTAAKDLGKSTGRVTKNVETPRKGEAFPHSGAAEPLVSARPIERNFEKPDSTSP